MHEIEDALICVCDAVSSNRRKCSRIPELLAILRPQDPIPTLVFRAVTHGSIPHRTHVLAKGSMSDSSPSSGVIVIVMHLAAVMLWSRGSALRQARRALPCWIPATAAPRKFIVLQNHSNPTHYTTNTCPTPSPKTHFRYRTLNI